MSDFEKKDDPTNQQSLPSTQARDGFIARFLRTAKVGLGAHLNSIRTTIGNHWVRAMAPRMPDEIRIGFAGNGRDGRQFVGSTTLALAHVRGLVEAVFAGTPTRVKWLFFKGVGPAVTRALAAGELDFAFQGDLPAVVARAKGLRTRLLLTTQLRSLSLAVPADSAIRSLDDLRGQRIATNQGAALQLAMARILSAAGLTERDVKMVNMNMTAAIAALAAHEIDATLVGAGAEELRARGLVKFAYSTEVTSAHLTSVGGFFVTEEFAWHYPESVSRVVRAVVEAAHWGSQPQNRDAVFSAWALSGYPVSAFRSIYGDRPLARHLSPLLDEFSLARFEAAAADGLRFGLVDRPVGVADWIDTKPLQAALNALHLENYWPAYDRHGNPK